MRIKYRIWLDDKRPMPGDSPTDDHKWFNHWCRTAEEAIELIDEGNVELISFDHDLGTRMTGYDVAKHIEKLCADHEIDWIDYYLHTGNIVGAGNIDKAMKNAKRLRAETQEDDWMQFRTFITVIVNHMEADESLKSITDKLRKQSEENYHPVLDEAKDYVERIVELMNKRHAVDE